MSEFNIPSFYQECKLKDIKVIGNSHGNEDKVMITKWSLQQEVYQLTIL